MGAFEGEKKLVWSWEPSMEKQCAWSEPSKAKRYVSAKQRRYIEKYNVHEVSNSSSSID